MIFYGFLLDTQSLGDFFVFKMLLTAHAVDGLSLLWHIFYHHVDEQLGILCHHIVVWGRNICVLVG